MSNKFKADLIGVYDHINGKTGVPFVGLSFRVGTGRIASIAANDERDEDGEVVTDVTTPIKTAFNDAKMAGKGLLFEVTDAVLVEETEELDDGTEVPMVIDGTRYYKIAGADLGVAPKLKRIGEITRGGTAAHIEL